MGVVSHLHSTVPEIERHVEPYGEIGKFLAQRYKEYADDHVGWSKEIWDMAPVAWLIDPDWCPSVLDLHADPDRDPDLEHRPRPPADALRPPREARPDPQGFLLEIEGLRQRQVRLLIRSYVRLKRCAGWRAIESSMFWRPAAW